MIYLSFSLIQFYILDALHFRWQLEKALRSGKLCIAIFRKPEGASDSEAEDQEASPSIKRQRHFYGSLSSSCSAMSASSGIRNSATDDDDDVHSDASIDSKSTSHSVSSKVCSIDIIHDILYLHPAFKKNLSRMPNF